ncbi:DUF2946 domain-containing protein [Hydrogenophaga sp.]|uniref:DUF2946 domain-containing protein n=1 Tax=Hydrogenophaga sp. TaxID=1904254 RepID=UPI003D12B5B5
MSLSRATHRLAAWLALFAMLLGALAPTVAQAVVVSQGGQGWVQVCSASGMVWVQADALEAQVDADGQKPMADASRHCPWCSLQGAAGLPPALPSQPVALESRTERPQARAGAPTPSTHWPAAPSRAPPLA